MTQTIDAPTVDHEVTTGLWEPGDHDRFSHVVTKTAKAAAYVTGEPARAVCGKVWVPNADPKRFPVCPTCKEIVDARRKAEGGDPINWSTWGD